MASIAKRGKSYCVIYSYVNEQGETKQKWESFKTHKEAKARKQTIEYEIMTGMFVAPKELTVEEFMEDFVRLYGEQRWSLGMYTGTVSTIRNYVNPIIGNRPIQSITTRDVDNYIAKLRKTKPVSSPIRKTQTEYSVTLDCDRKFRNFWGSSQAIRRLNDTICLENGYSIVADPQDSSASAERYPGEKRMSHRDKLRLDIDRALEQKPADFDALLKLLRDAGYEIKLGKNPSFKLAGQKRAARLDTLGDGYAKDDLIAVIAGTRKHIPRKVPVRTDEPKKLGLVIDIQRKLQEDKGAGYKQWASVYNLKQLAQSVNYIQDRGLTDYDELAKRTEEASARYHDLGSQIKEIEKRMEETAAMRRHIINYVKTKDVYTAYRKAGYSKRFLAEHESEITLHKAAKKAFDELGLEKLPTVRSLQDEYSRLAEEKKKLFTEFRKSREEMKDLLTAKANVDRVLGYDGRAADKQKEQTQR